MSVHDHMPGVKEIMQYVMGAEVGGPINWRGARPSVSYRWFRRKTAKLRHRAHVKARKELNRAG